MIKENWFKEWFNSEYYHLLYNNRDNSEAQLVIKNLFEYLQLPQNAKILDLACGKGRHAIQVSEMGFDTVGIDLSEESIQFAKQFEKSQLKFEIGDMRKLTYRNEFDLVLNLFTSFGYFKEEESNFQVIQSIEQSLKKKGYLVLDYLNVEKVKPFLPLSEEIHREGVVFKISKFIKENFIVKEICFEVNGDNYKQTELVELITEEQFETYFQRANLKLLHKFGDYSLADFDVLNSDRLILLAKK